MIESLRMIGQWNFSQTGYESPRELIIKGRVEDLDKFIASRIRNQGKGHIVVLIVDPVNRSLDLDIRNISKGELIKYTYVGHRKGPISQDILTVKNSEYITGKGKKKPSVVTISNNLREKLQKIDKEIFNAIWYDEVLDGHRFGDILRFLEAKFTDEDFKNWFRNEVSRKVSGYCKNDCIYTLAVKLHNGKIIELARTRSYKRYILATVLYRLNSQNFELLKGYCYVCNRESDVLPEPNFPQASLLKIYTLDKLNYVSGLSRKREMKMKNFSICPECNFLIESGLRYVESKYTVNKVIPTRLRGRGKDNERGNDKLYVNMYIIPSVSNKKVGVDLLGINEELKTLFTWEHWNDLQNFLKKISIKLSKKAGSMYYIHLIFGGTKANSSDFTYVGSIQDVPVFDMIRPAQILSEAKRDSGFKPTDTLLRNFPVGTLKSILRVDPEEDEVSVRDFLYLMRVLMVKEPFNDQYLYTLAGKTAKVLRFRLNWTKTKNAEKIFIDTILKYLFLLKVIYKILGKNNIDGMSSTNVNQSSPTDQVLEETMKLLEDKELTRFIRFLGLDRARTALFLLGVLVAEIGCQQSKKGDNRKAVLNKLKYPGMNRYDVIELANYIPFGLRHYRIFNDMENLYSATKRLLDTSINDLGTPEENLFYILSGYAYQTYRLKSGGGCDEEEG